MDEFCEKSKLPLVLKNKIRTSLQYSSVKSILSESEKEEFFNYLSLN